MKPNEPHSFTPRNPTEHAIMSVSRPWIHLTRATPEAQALREAAQNLAAVHKRPAVDANDSDAGRAWTRLAEAAVQYAALAGTRSKK